MANPFRSSMYVVMAVLIVGVAATVASANHSWGGFHWERTTDQLNLNLGDNVVTAWDSYLMSSAAEWSTSSVLNTTSVIGGTNKNKGKLTPKNCVPTLGRVEVCSSRYGANGWLGLASIWAIGEHITQGTVKLNDTYFTGATYNTPAWRNLVMCQEIAHTFGLGHQDEDFYNPNLGSCMDYTADPDGTLADPDQLDNQNPNQHDYDQLEAIYSHLETASTGSSGTSLPGQRLGQDENFSDASEWGTAIRFDAEGRPSLFVRNLGNNERIITHVFWVR